MEHLYSYIDENVERIRERITKAANLSGRRESDITLMAAVKSADTDEINYIHSQLGIDHVGENRVQQLLDRYDKLDKTDLEIHFIGSLQTNKVKYISDKVSLIHSLDSIKLCEEIQKQAKKRGIISRVLVEINSGNEENKGGIDLCDAERFCESIQAFDSVELCGFMTMAPKCEKKSDYYPYFDATREISEKIWKETLGRSGYPIISMGMSESFEPAIECGATLVRIGRTLFAKGE